MTRRVTFAATALAVVPTLIAALATVLTGTTTAGATIASPPLAAEDSFYSPPTGFTDTTPGTILRSRRVQVAAFSLLPQRVEAWQLLYRTTTQAGAPMATVTTVLRPAGRTAKGLVSYQIAQDASAAHCAPSHAVQVGPVLDGASGNIEMLLADAAVGNGFAVSMPDYQGPDSEFGAPRQPGYAVLDGIRAAEQFGPLGLPGTATPVGIWGYSGGSLPSGWAAQVQAAYAPELVIKGVAVGGFVTDLGQAIIQINGGLFSGLLPSVLPGVIRSDSGFAALVDKYGTPEGRAMLVHSATQCLAPNILQYPFLNLDKYLTIPLAQVLRKPDIQAALARVNLGGSAPTAPLYVYHAVHDEIIPITGTDQTVTKYCAGGTPVTYTRDLLSEHATLQFLGAPAALSWLTDRINGATPPARCSTRTVLSTTLTGLQVPAFLISAIRGLLTRPGSRTNVPG